MPYGLAAPDEVHLIRGSFFPTAVWNVIDGSSSPSSPVERFAAAAGVFASAALALAPVESHGDHPSLVPCRLRAP